MPDHASSEVDSDMRFVADIGERLDPAELPRDGGYPPARESKRHGDETVGVGWLTAAGLAEGGLLADVGIVLDLAAIYLPVVGTVLSFAVPTPFAILMLRRGTRATLLSVAVASFLITVLCGPHFGWRMGLEATLGFLLGWAMRARIRPSVTVAGGTVLVAIATFVAAMGVIFVTGLPVSDVVDELRNALESLAWLAATGASILGLQSQWLAIRPTLVALGLLGLHVWPLLLFCSLAAAALPVVASYYALANATAQVLGHDVREFPSRRFLRALRTGRQLLALPVLRLLRMSSRRRSGRVSSAGDPRSAREGSWTDVAPVQDIASTAGEKE